jgi:deoxyribose-phosphate aldolase
MELQKPDRNIDDTGQLELLVVDPLLTEQETLENCRSGLRYNPAVIWVKPCYIQAAAAFLRDKHVRVGTTIGCLDGSTHTKIKVAEAKRALTEGATHLGMYINLGFLREEKNDVLLVDLQAVSGITHMNGAIFEVVLDSAYLESTEMVEAAKAAKQAGADVVSVTTQRDDFDWDFSLIERIKEAIGDSVIVKGLLHSVEKPQLLKLFNKGLDCFGIERIVH